MAQKVAVSREFQAGDWISLSVNPAENGTRQRKERDGLHLLSAVPKIQWDSSPHCPYG